MQALEETMTQTISAIRTRYSRLQWKLKPHVLKMDWEEFLKTSEKTSEVPLPPAAHSKRTRKKKLPVISEDIGEPLCSSTAYANRLGKRTPAADFLQELTVDEDQQSVSTASSFLKPVNPYATPLNAVHKSVIVPKVNPQTPATVTRQPRKNELFFSVDGSPITLEPEEETIEVRFKDGLRVHVPTKETGTAGLSTLDENLRKQLELLKQGLQNML